MTFFVFIITFAFVAHHAMMIYNVMTRKRINRSRDMSNVTIYRGQTFNRHGRAID